MTRLDLRPIPRAPGYCASRGGDIYSLVPRWPSQSPKRLSPALDAAGYPSVIIVVKGRRTHLRVPWLIASAFLEPRPAGMELNHKNGDKADSRIDNLEYVTHARNMAHASETGLLRLGEECRSAKLTTRNVLRIRDLAKRGVSQKALAFTYGVDPSNISFIVNRKKWRHV